MVDRDQEKERSYEEYEVPALISDGLVLFPNSEVITSVKDKTNLSAVREALKREKIVAHIPPSSWGVKGTIGTLALLEQSNSIEGGGGLNLRLKGMWRIRVESFFHTGDYTKVRFERVEEHLPTTSTDGTLLVSKVHNEIDEIVKFIPSIPTEIINLLIHTNDPGDLADLCANSPNFTPEEKIDLLGTLDQMERLSKVSELLEAELVALRKASKIEPISECEKCIELADNAFESDPSKMSEIAISFLNHVVNEHTGELLALLAEKYGPVFLNRRMLK